MNRSIKCGPYDGLLSSQKKEGSTDSCCNMDELENIKPNGKSYTQKVTYRRIQNREISTDRK